MKNERECLLINGKCSCDYSRINSNRKIVKVQAFPHSAIISSDSVSYAFGDDLDAFDTEFVFDVKS